MYNTHYPSDPLNILSELEGEAKEDDENDGNDGFGDPQNGL